ncbi:MAG: hypothetical protein K1X67_11725 [Fimbriimonadaceae bacterium]|nr:hypothetical protein [Fimbriimonadaceae bacterium]
MRRFGASLLFVGLYSGVHAATLTVGAGKTYARIEDAVTASRAGDTIAVYRASGSGAYVRPMISIAKANLKIIGMGTTPVLLDGTGGNYSGAGSVPRALIQVNPGGDGLLIENLDLRNAHNDTHNGAGVRINQASRVTIRKCRITANDMGIMSNGNGSSTSASDQLIEYCRIDGNGSLADPGYNHNLYLGGTGATVQFCDIAGALTGHNFKSRAHFNLIRYNYIHDSANREIDLVDASETARPNSHSVLLGNLIVKKANTDGNRGTVHFGQDGGGQHSGTLYLINNTIVTPYLSPVLLMTASQGKARFVNNVIFNSAQSAPALIQLPAGAPPSTVTGDNNWISKGYSLAGTAISLATRYQGSSIASHPGFANVTNKDYWILPASATFPTIAAPTYLDGGGVSRSAIPTFQYRAVAQSLAISWTSKRYLGAGLKR